MKTCTKDNCDRQHRARGLCSSHYNQEHAPNRHSKKMVACSVCGTEVMKYATDNKARRPVCSDQCRKNLPRLKPTKSQTQSKLPRDHWALWFGKTSAWPRYAWTTCAHCGTDFLPKSTNAKYCSRKCMWTWHERKAGARSQADIAAEVRNCQRCSAAYQSPSPQRVHCSDLCRDQAATERGTHLYHGWIRPAIRTAIYERDGHMCWLCGESVDYTADPQRDDWAPTLDHITPRSKGGTHDVSNLRTAHRWCNAVRSDKDEAESYDWLAA